MAVERTLILYVKLSVQERNVGSVNAATEA